jgi:hypothetical protein
MTPEAQELLGALRAACGLRNTDAITGLWRDAAGEVRDEFRLLLPRAAVFLEQLLSGELPPGFEPVGPWGSGIGGALGDPDFDPANLGGRECAAARCLAKFFRAEAALLRALDPATDFEYSWQILRRLPLAGDDAVGVQERTLVDRAAFACGLPEAQYSEVRGAILKRIPALLRLVLPQLAKPIGPDSANLEIPQP